MLTTRAKVALANALSSALAIASVKMDRRCRRHGVTFELDLREGIDLSLFVLGEFQSHVLKLIRQFVPRDGIVVDVGANVGAISLPAAVWLDQGHVYAIEPTDFAFAKLQRNLSCNPEIAKRITAVRTFIADESKAESDLTAFSSWPLGAAAPDSLHSVHRGMKMSTTCGQITMDEFLSERNVRASLIKIDTDGNEFAILKGAHAALESMRPVVIFEACEYLMTPPRPTYEDFETLFERYAYIICDPKSLKAIDAISFRRCCPRGAGLDLMAVPDERLRAMRALGRSRSA